MAFRLQVQDGQLIYLVQKKQRPDGAMLAKPHWAGAPRLCFGACELDVPAHSMRYCGRDRHLEPRGFEVLLYLLAHRDRVVSKYELLDAIWPTAHVTENVVARCVMKLRRALGDTDRNGCMIRTIHRVGYRFDALVTEWWPEAVDARARCDEEGARTQVE
jgi:DNA-binding winged helix-turn-helix (wHTH) protein